MRTRHRVYRSHPLSERAGETVPTRTASPPTRARAGSMPPVSEVEEWQRAAGNQATARSLQDPRTQTLAPNLVPNLGEDEGMTGEVAFEGVPWTESVTASPQTAETSEWGEFDGEIITDVDPHVFVNGGKTGSGIVQWVAGGDGGRGNQNVGSISLVAPVYESAPTVGFLGPSAWIRAGTGTLTVTRSYRGVLVGANSTQFYFTAAAAARADVHEQAHVNASLLLHTIYVFPLEMRIALNTGRSNARFAGATEAEAIAALQTYIDWNATVTTFQNADIAANTPMGTVDTADLAAPDFVKHLGPRTVGGVNYNDYIDV